MQDYLKLLKASNELSRVIKFNYLSTNTGKKIIPLGGISYGNLNKLKLIKCDAFAVMSEIKKKPAIIDRLF